MLTRLTPPGSPVPMGPYSPAVVTDGFVFVAGQGPLLPGTNQMSLGDIEHETRLVIENLKTILEGASASLAHVVKVNVYLANASDFPAMNQVYEEYFGAAKPVRTTVICRFVAPIKVEIDCIACTV